MLNVSIVHRLLVAATTALVPLLMLSSTEDARAQTGRKGQFRVLMADGTFSANILTVGEIDWTKARVQPCAGNTCVVKVKVTVPDAGTLCSWEFPHALVVKKNNATIEWQLTSDSSAGAEFVDKADGVDTGVDIKPDASGSKHYGNHRYAAKVFSWKRHTAGVHVHAYNFNVQFDSGKKTCDVPDPLIINTD